ncbi:MAG: hypothetical protein ACREHG_03410 [Candidatus Saccharimonadales bacterium]
MPKCEYCGGRDTKVCIPVGGKSYFFCTPEHRDAYVTKYNKLDLIPASPSVQTEQRIRVVLAHKDEKGQIHTEARAETVAGPDEVGNS